MICIKLCPFCGQNEQRYHETDEGMCIRCDYCGALGPWCGRMKDAEKLWNERGAEIVQESMSSDSI